MASMMDESGRKLFKDGLFETRSNYAPPYDSPIEDIFAWTLDKHLDPRVNVIPQCEIPTRAGTFRLDFLIEGSFLKVGIECDGKEFHDAHRDEWRDANILAVKGVDRLYRFSGKDLHHHTDHCIALMMQYEPFLFSERGRLNLATLVAEDLPEFEKSGFAAQDFGPIRATRYVYMDPPHGKRQFPNPWWTVLARFALDHPPMPLEQMIAAFSQHQRENGGGF